MNKYAYNNLTDFEYMHWYICLEIDIILTKSKIWSYLSYIKFNSFWCNHRPNTVLNNIYDKHENTLNNIVHWPTMIIVQLRGKVAQSKPKCTTS